MANDYYSREFSNLPDKRKPDSLIDKLERCQEVGLLFLKGYTYKDIAEKQEISPATAKKYVDEYMVMIRRQAEVDPDFMDRVQENTLRFLKEFDEISKEAWETVDIATDSGMVGARINALKLAAEIATQKARLLQLLGAKVDSSYVARMQRAETVNQILSNVIAEVVSDCEHCRDEARIRISEALAMMGDENAAINAQPFIEEAELVYDEADEISE